MADTAFGNLLHAPRLIKRPVNPLDKCTIVSVYPRRIVEKKETIFPGLFVIPAAPKDGFSLLVVGPSSGWREVDESQPYLEMQVNSFDIARSVIQDYCGGLMDCNMADAMPGVFYLPGEFTETSIQLFVDPMGKKFKDYLDEAKTKQMNWYKRLVNTADVLWSRTNGNPLAISDDARLAAESLGLDKPWMNDMKHFEMKNCMACGHMVNPSFPVCPNCKNIIDEEKAKTIGIKFAK